MAEARQPFARASFARTDAYYHEFWQAAQLRPWWNRLAMAIGAANVVPGILLISRPIGWVALAVGIILLVRMPVRRCYWMKQRKAETPEHDNQMHVEFFDDAILASTALAVSEVDWQAIQRARQHPCGLALWLHGNSLFYIPLSSIEPPASVALIVEKAGTDRTSSG